jgi:hypothetical protein
LPSAPSGALDAAEAAVDAMRGMPGVILPFPGGVVRSGSKVGARAYAAMIASTNDAYCPTLRPVTDSSLPDGVNSVLEIVLDGLDFASITRAMRVGIDAACRPGVAAITAGNYGGRPRPAPLPPAPHPLGRRHAGPEAGPGAGAPARGGGRPVSDVVVLTLRAAPDGPLDVEGALSPDRLAGLAEREIAALPVWLGAREARLGDFFDVRGGRSPRVRVAGATARLDGLAVGAAGGELVVEGDAGRRVGAGMTGGAVTVLGSVGDDAGAGMAGGTLRVEGNAGTGSAPPRPAPRGA